MPPNDIRKNETYGIKEFDPKEICENMQERESEWGCDARNDKEVLLTHNKNLSQREDQDNKSLINFPQSVFVVRSNTYEYFTHDKPFIRNLLTMKDNIIIAGNNVKVGQQNWEHGCRHRWLNCRDFQLRRNVAEALNLRSQSAVVLQFLPIKFSQCGKTTVLSAQHREHTLEKILQTVMTVGSLC